VCAAGGTVRTGVRVAEIRTHAGQTRGVTLEDGRHIDAPTVISSGDPRATIVDLLRGEPGPGRALVDRWRARGGGEGYESKIDAVISELPRARGIKDAHLQALGVDDPLVATMIVTPSLAGLAGAAAAAGRGRVVTRPPMLANVPSVLDPSVTPPGGGHVFSLEVLFTPYALEGGWEDSPEPQRWLDTFATLVEPGFLEGIERWRVVGPQDYERDFSMPRGYAPSFSGGPLAALLGRDRELTRYRTPVPGLFLTGAGTFPGAGVSGAPGRNAAQVVVKTLADARA
jgi:phytoene dehydrogenase-like protein